jgi:hypothetical protein
MIIVALVAAASVVSAIASEPACTAPATAAAAFASSALVFTARVGKVSADDLGYYSIAEVEVLQIWKGKKRLSKTIRVDGHGGPTYPARVFKRDTEYLFYISSAKSGGRFHADSFCDRVLELDAAPGDLEFLGSQKPD